MTAAGSPAVPTAAGRPYAGGRRIPLDWVGTLPFFAYVGLFLLLPTAIIAFGSFVDVKGNPTLANYRILTQSYIVTATINTIVMSALTAILGAFLGALVAYAISTGNPQGLLRRTVTAASGVLAQFGGVTLAFAFLASIGPAGIVYLLLKDHGLDWYASGYWIYDLRGLELVYLYFQVPLMVLVFLPALDGIKPQWREATESLGGGTWHYWRYVAGPLLAPAFLGATLLLFANAFSAYATAAALVNQGGIVIALQISNLLTSETGYSDPGLAKALAVFMVVIVAAVTALYTLLQQRTSRWLQ